MLDEHPRANITEESLSKLKTVFKENGTVTAGNSSGVNDGSAAMLLMKREEAEKRNLKPLAKIISWATCGVEPALMGTGPIPASKSALKKAGWKVDDLDLQILSELSNDASISVPRLSKKIDVNSSVVYSRIKRLVKRKLIERFTIDVNDAELGYEVKALTGINIDTKQRDNVIEQLFKIDGVREVAEVTGRFDILVTMYSRSLDQMHKMVSEKIGRVEGIQSSESFIEMKSRTKAMPYMPSNTGE